MLGATKSQQAASVRRDIQSAPVRVQPSERETPIFPSVCERTALVFTTETGRLPCSNRGRGLPDT
jgi:hypothetical protein